MRELSSNDVSKVSGGADPLSSALTLVASPFIAVLVTWSSAGQLTYAKALNAIWRSVLSGGKY